MLASRQVLGNVARSRAAASLSLRRTMATVTDSPLDRKVCHIALLIVLFCSRVAG